MIPLTALYCLFTLLVSGTIFVLLYAKRGLKPAAGFAILSLVILVALFLVFMTLSLNAMG